MLVLGGRWWRQVVLGGGKSGGVCYSRCVGEG